MCNVSFIFDFHQVDYDVPRHSFPWVSLVWCSLRFLNLNLCLIISGKFLAMLFQIFSFCTNLFLLSSGNLMTNMLNLIELFYRSLRLCSFFNTIVFVVVVQLDNFCWRIFMFTDCVISILLFNSNSEFSILVIIFYGLKFFFWFFCILYTLSAQNFYLSICFKRVLTYFIEHGYHTCFKIFVW